jgi:Transglycosylase SLT domain
LATVIDQLIVTLGLDGSQFKKGTDEADRRLKATREGFKKSGEAMTKSITDVARNIAVAFIGFESASGLISFLAKINQAQASLSRMALNFGTSARALDVWDKKIELAGGTAQSAQGAINQLNQDIKQLQLGHEPSALLKFMAAMRIDIFAMARGSKTAQQALEELFAAMGKKPRADMFQLATAAGLSPDVLSYGLRPLAEREAISKEAERLSQVTEANAKSADDLRMRWVAIQKQLESIGQVFLEKITPTIERLLPIVERLGNEFANWMASLSTPDAGKSLFDTLDARVDGLLSKLKSLRDEIRKLLSGDFSDVPAAAAGAVRGAFNSPSEALDKFKAHDPIFGAQEGSALSGLKRWLVRIAGPYQAAFNAASEKYKLPNGLIRGVAMQESSLDPNAVNEKSGARGLMGLNPKYFPNAGKDPFADIDTAGAELKRLLLFYKGDQDMALAAYNDGQKNLARNIAAGTVPRETLNYPQQVAAQMSRAKAAEGSRGAGSTTSIQIDNIEINTQATDGKQVAHDFVREMKSRDLILQFDTGIVP